MKVPHSLAKHQEVSINIMGGDTDTFSRDLFGVHADLLIPGRGEPIQYGGMIISKADGIIVWVGAYPSLPSKYNRVAFTKYSGVLMPGMCMLKASPTPVLGMPLRCLFFLMALSRFSAKVG